jgi:8-oxo-dGTP pyrophosphatase MutT (NUDIX family)
MNNRKAFVIGFAFNEAKTEVVLISKNRPEWQAGLLNAVGGKIEDNDTPEYAMQREFHEETGVVIAQHRWTQQAIMNFDSSDVYVLSATLSDSEMSSVDSVTDEQVDIYDVNCMLTNAVPAVKDLKLLMQTCLTDCGFLTMYL